MASLGNKMIRTKLNDATSIPMLAYGTGTAMFKAGTDSSIDRTRVEQMKTALRLGYYHLDCAEYYNTEPELGVAIKESKVPREQLFVTTKVWKGLDDIPKAIERSLKKLQLDYVDLFLIHSPFDLNTPEAIQAAWKSMESIKTTGQARSIGVSNFPVSALQSVLSVAKIPPSVNQIEYHPYLQQPTLASFCAAHEITLAAYSPQVPLTKAKSGPLDPILEALARKYAVNAGEILLRWCVQKGVVAVTTSGKEQRLSDYMRILAFALTPAEMREIDDAGRKKHFRSMFAEKMKAADEEDAKRA